MALRLRFLTSTSSSVPFLCRPFLTYPIAIFLFSVGEGMPDVIVPICSSPEKILAPSKRRKRVLASIQCMKQYGNASYVWQVLRRSQTLLYVSVDRSSDDLGLPLPL